MPRELTRESLPMAVMFAPGVTRWLVSAAGDDVATALAFHSTDTCGVFNVATAPEHRRRGHGASVTAQSVLAAFGAGARVAYLQSSPMGVPVYERLGFVTVEQWRQWMPEKYVGGQ